MKLDCFMDKDLKNAQFRPKDVAKQTFRTQSQTFRRKNRAKTNKGGCLYPISLEVNKNSSGDLSNEDEQEAGEILEEEMKEMSLIQTH